MNLTDFFHGRTIVDIRRNSDGSVEFCCDSKSITLCVIDNQIVQKPSKLVTDAVELAPVELPQRMRLLEAFQGFKVDHVLRLEAGGLKFVLFPVNPGSIGHREVDVPHDGKVISELPPVSAVIKIPSLVMGLTQRGA